MKVGKLVVGAVVVGVGVAVAVELVKQTGLKDKVQETASGLLVKGTGVLADMLTRYDEWTNSFVGEGNGASQENPEPAKSDPWAAATHDGQGAGLR